MPNTQAHAEALSTSMDHHRILSFSRQAVLRRLLSDLPSTLHKNDLTSDNLDARTFDPSEEPGPPRQDVRPILPQRRPCPLCVIYRQMFGKSPAKTWSAFGKRFKERPNTSEPDEAPFGSDSANNASASALSITTTDDGRAASPQEASSPLFARCSSDPPSLLTRIVSASKKRHVTTDGRGQREVVHRRASCDTGAKDTFRRLRSDPSKNSKPREEFTALSRVPSTAAGERRGDVKREVALKPVGAARAARQPR